MKTVRSKILMLSCTLAFLAVGLPLQAETLHFSFVDRVGDTGSATGPQARIDLTHMTFAFDRSTGKYEIRYFADPAKPFAGDFRLSTNLFNPGTGTRNPNPSLFSYTLNQYNLISTTAVVLTGADSRLLSWDPGDSVANDSVSFGNPSGWSGFVTGLTDLTMAKQYGYWVGDNLDSANTTIVPEPATLSLLVAGAILAGRRCRRP
jgi:hypothetical protein